MLETNFLASIIKTNMDGILMVAKNPKYSNVIKDVYNDIRKSIDEVSRHSERRRIESYEVSGYVSYIFD